MRRVTAAAVALALLLGSGPVAAELASSKDGSFTLEWEAAERRGRPVVRGYIRNEFPLPATDVQLRIEGLDATGRVVATTIGYLPRTVTNDRQYFEVRVPAPAASYRVTVAYFVWVRPGSM